MICLFIIFYIVQVIVVIVMVIVQTFDDYLCDVFKSKKQILKSFIPFNWGWILIKKVLTMIKEL